MDDVDDVDERDDEEDLEPAWPGWRSLVSGRAGMIAVVLTIVVGFWAYRMVVEQQRFDAPSHTDTVCVDVGSLVTPTDAGGASVGVPPVCVTGHS